MLHPSFHGDLAYQHQRDLERTAAHARLAAEAKQAEALHAPQHMPDVTERVLFSIGRLLIGWGQGLCARSTPAARAALLRTSPHTALRPASTWQPGLLARMASPAGASTPITLVYYGFVTVGPHGVTRAEYLTPLAHPAARGHTDSERRN